MILEIDELTAAFAAESLAAHGRDLIAFAQAIDEEWKRHGVDPSTGTRHLISTMGNRHLTNPPHYHTQLIDPDPVPAEARPAERRFLRGAPKFCAEIVPTDAGYRLATTLLRLGDDVHLTYRLDAPRCGIDIRGSSLPDTVLDALVGRDANDVVAMPGGLRMPITGWRHLSADTVQEVFNTSRSDVRATRIEFDRPPPAAVEFTPIYIR